MDRQREEFGDEDQRPDPSYEQIHLLFHNDKACERLDSGHPEYKSARVQKFTRYDLGSLTIDEMEEMIGKNENSKNKMCILSLFILRCVEHG